MSTTRVARHLRAPRSAVYAALLDPEAVARWRVPEGMTAEVHDWEAREGGRFRVSLSYDDGTAGKTEANRDTYAGRFAELVPDERVVEVLAFESADPELRGEMTMTWTLREAEGGTELQLVHQGVPDGVCVEDNETGTRMALAQLAAYVEAAG